MIATLIAVLSESTLFVIIYLLTTISLGIVTAWVYYDAKEKGNNKAWAWAGAVAGLSLLGGIPGIILLSIYVIQR